VIPIEIPKKYKIEAPYCISPSVLYMYHNLTSPHVKSALPHRKKTPVFIKPKQHKKPTARHNCA
jgi:hypothetical protein